MITLTDAAVEKVREFMTMKNREDLALRIYVSRGGCSGFSYGMALDEPQPTDNTFQFGPIKVVIDPDSAPLLDGIEVDYVNSLMGGGFSIENPNAVSSCGCGHSFRTKDQAGAPNACSH
ncbi:iron-sulfur cluster assembly accessory protein [Sulfobacillus acidophilus TPY]|uniref:Iron-sulfur cluster assembly accessory protein n=1 Tax=Sulfobacillus acidophilus (strain ATCC 700253 / DSM 10332 / NAL) TaxID=679936 RepID=G8TVR2_SULAD|nr:iron-sulfur cluster assembly accessory protein [Sulfobacillus acidophilus TPY]AEW03701.1 iron-sulfur cluster assembly accessory protein [Sulfobacillus acidophilus DSM 10332]